MTQLDFRLSDACQHVAVYHGQADTYVRPEATAQLAGVLPGAEVHLIPGGYLCVFTSGPSC